jgi:glycine/D-amino acid oxidase-like deaminating enzyme
MRIAVIGGGIFGCTAAIHAARAEHEVHLFEKADALMQGASAVNQFRLHRGYHYPRSPETGRECRVGNRSFCQEYGGAVIQPEQRKRGGQYYAIAQEGSKVSGEDYQRFLVASQLPARPVPDCMAGLRHVDRVFDVLEAAIDPVRLRDLVVDKLVGVHVHLQARELPSRKDFDRIIIAAYANTNTVAAALGCETTPFQFEVCEKPVVRLPSQWRDTGIVVMDGPFCSIDPYGTTGLHLLGHVVHAIHEMSVGEFPPSAEPRQSNIEGFIDAGSHFFPALREAEYLRSMWTVRAVLPNKDATDERPTLVHRLDDQVVRIFSGKIGTAVEAARQALWMLEDKRVAA